MEKKAGAIMKEFNDMIFPAGYDANSGKRKVRRAFLYPYQNVYY